MPDGVATEYVRFGAAAPTPLCQSHLYPLDGAAARVGRGETAWPWRDAAFAQMFAGVSPQPGHDAELGDWVQRFSAALEPYAMAGAYANFTMDGEPEAARACYGDNHARLAAIKAAYDPENLLRHNPNVEPAA